MKKLFLAIALTTAAAFPVLAGMQHDHSSMAKAEDMSHKMETLDTKIGGYDVSLDILTHKAYQDMMMKMKMDFMKPASGTTHHIAVTIRKEGQKVEDAAVNLKVVPPAGKEESKALPYNPDMMFQYVGHFNMPKKGKYQLLITFDSGKESHQGKVIYEVR